MKIIVGELYENRKFGNYLAEFLRDKLSGEKGEVKITYNHSRFLALNVKIGEYDFPISVTFIKSFFDDDNIQDWLKWWWRLEVEPRMRGGQDKGKIYR